MCEQDNLAATAQSIFFCGAIVGGLVFGWIADKYGRIPALVGKFCQKMREQGFNKIFEEFKRELAFNETLKQQQTNRQGFRQKCMSRLRAFK